MTLAELRDVRDIFSHLLYIIKREWPRGTVDITLVEYTSSIRISIELKK